MSKASNTFENEFLKHLFQNVSIPKIGDAAGLLPSAVAGDFYLRLCTDAVVVSDSQIGTECSYTGYVAKGIAVARSAAGWTVTGSNATNAADLLFGACSAVPQNIRYVELWRDNVGATEADRIAWTQLTADLAITAGVQPKFAIGDITFTFD